MLSDHDAGPPALLWSTTVAFPTDTWYPNVHPIVMTFEQLESIRTYMYAYVGYEAVETLET